MLYAFSLTANAFTYAGKLKCRVWNSGNVPEYEKDGLKTDIFRHRLEVNLPVSVRRTTKKVDPGAQEGLTLSV
jgi:hypothetical protein